MSEAATSGVGVNLKEVWNDFVHESVVEGKERNQFLKFEAEIGFDYKVILDPCFCEECKSKSPDTGLPEFHLKAKSFPDCKNGADSEFRDKFTPRALFELQDFYRPLFADFWNWKKLNIHQYENLAWAFHHWGQDYPLDSLLYVGYMRTEVQDLACPLCSGYVYIVQNRDLDSYRCFWCQRSGEILQLEPRDPEIIKPSRKEYFFQYQNKL